MLAKANKRRYNRKVAQDEAERGVLKKVVKYEYT
jgi:hypothetical protein